MMGNSLLRRMAGRTVGPTNMRCHLGCDIEIFPLCINSTRFTNDAILQRPNNYEIPDTTLLVMRSGYINVKWCSWFLLHTVGSALLILDQGLNNRRFQLKSLRLTVLSLFLIMAYTILKSMSNIGFQRTLFSLAQLQ